MHRWGNSYNLREKAHSWLNCPGRQVVLGSYPSCGPGVITLCLKSFICNFLNTSGVLQDRLLEESLTEPPYVYYHNLTQAPDKYRSKYDKTEKSCGPFLLQANEDSIWKKFFYTWNCSFCAFHCIAPAWLQTINTYFVPCSTHWLKNCWMLSRTIRLASIIITPKRTSVLNYSSLHKHSTRYRAISKSDILRIIE